MLAEKQQELFAQVVRCRSKLARRGEPKGWWNSVSKTMLSGSHGKPTAKITPAVLAGQILSDVENRSVGEPLPEPVAKAAVDAQQAASPCASLATTPTELCGQKTDEKQRAEGGSSCGRPGPRR